MEQEFISLEDVERQTDPSDTVENTTEESALDSDVGDELGAALGLTYQDDEALSAGTKEAERDHHRWELDPASAEDYAERTHERADGLSGEILHMTHEGHIPHRR